MATVNKEERLWLVYVTKGCKWGASDITPAIPPNYYAGYFEEVGMMRRIEADNSLEEGSIKKYYLVKEVSRYKAIQKVKEIILILP